MKKLDRFNFLGIISDGPQGAVYKAEESLPGDNHRVVALKVLEPFQQGDNVAPERFFSEVKVLAQLAVQPNIVTIYSMGVTDGYPWIAMEYAEATAEQKMAEEPADPAEVARLIEQVGRGLLAMHNLTPPLVHQDLKPANILLDGAGNYKITDFSLATAVAANRTHGLATVRYAAPELLSSEFGKISPATDLYSLGHIAYEMALGARQHRQQFKAVFEGNSTREPPANKWMMWHASGNTRPDSVAEIKRDFPTGLSDLIAHLMAKPAAQRYATAQEVLNDLAALHSQAIPAASAVSLSATPASPSAPPSPPLAPSPAPSAPPADEAAPLPRTPPLRAPAVPTNTRYWVRLRGRVTGPYDLATMQRQIRQGQISRLHQVSADQVTWKTAAEIEGFYGTTIV